MFDLEAAIRNWRSRAERRWAGDRLALDELEDHLREEFALLAESGHSLVDAWSIAVSKLGDPVEISKEFAKLGRLTTPDRIVLGLIVGAAVCVTTVIIRSVAREPDDPVLTLYVVVLVLGYLSGLFAAAVAGYGTIRGLLARVPILPLTRATRRLVRVASLVAAILTVSAFGIGAIWAAGELGSWFPADPRQIGAIVVSISFIAAAGTAGRAGISPRIPLAVAIGGGGIILAAWFGPAAYTRDFPTWPTIIGFGGCGACIAVAAMSLTVRETSTAATI